MTGTTKIKTQGEGIIERNNRNQDHNVMQMASSMKTMPAVILYATTMSMLHSSPTKEIDFDQLKYVTRTITIIK